MKLVLIVALSAFLQATQPNVVHAIFRSTDRGRSWSRSDRGMPGTTRINAFAVLDRTLFAGTDSGVYLSADEGRSWRRSPGWSRSSPRVISLAASGQTLFAGTDRSGLLVSADKGISWTINSALPAQKVRSLLADRRGIYAGTETDGVFFSANEAKTWTRLQQGLPPQAQIFTMAIVKGKLFAGLYGKGLYAWSDRDARWTSVAGVSPLVLTRAGDTLIAGHNPGGIFWSDDLGSTWTHHSGELPREAPVWDAGSDGDLVFAGAGSGIFYSEDRGRSWVRSRKGLPSDRPGISFLVKGDLILAGAILPALQ